MADTDKVKPDATLNGIAKSLSLVKSLGGGGTAIIVAVIIGAQAWFSSQVQAIVRAEVAPINERLLRLELKAEYETTRKDATK